MCTLKDKIIRLFYFVLKYIKMSKIPTFMQIKKIPTD